MGLGVDFQRIQTRVEQAARKAGDQASKSTLERVRKHAPVRKLFRGTTYRGEGIDRAPRVRSVTVAKPVQRVRGHANSDTPLLRNRTPSGTITLVGDFRRIDPKRPGRLAAISLRSGGLEVFHTSNVGRVKRLDPKTIKPISGEQVQVTGGKALTSQGKYEVRSGRANYRSGGKTRVGGRLKGELHVEGPRIVKGIMWWSIVSRTKDPETGRLYGRDQEFGTRHHPPHSFMRPGLRESATGFKKQVRNEMNEAVRRR